MAPATFSDLPPEMVSNVFTFVRQKADQGAICLVSRAWRDQMAPMMWEVFEADLGAASARSMATLLHPRSGILIHVRDLAIDGTKKGEDRLKLVVAAIPRDRVRSFWTRIDMEPLTLHLLLLSQRKIEDLIAFKWYESPGYDFEKELESMGPLLPELSSVQLEIETNMGLKERVSNALKSISHYCPKITALWLSNIFIPASEGLGVSLSALFSHPKEAPLFPNLTELRLFRLNIAMPGEPTLCKNFNMSQLRSLQIRDCDYLIPFLEGLSSFFIDNTGELDELMIALPMRLDQPPETIQAMERLLRVCPKLQVLLMDLSKHGPVAKDCVLAHCQKLISLLMSTWRLSSGGQFSARDMSFILEACTKLESLAVNISSWCIRDLPKLEAGFRLDADFEDMLTSISANSTIRALRIFDPPILDWGDRERTGRPRSSQQSALYQVLMQNHANQILQFMAKQGSNLKILSFNPSRKMVQKDEEDKDPNMDGNGHQWPEYHYCRGSTTDVTGTNIVIAHPLRNVALEFPGLADFDSWV
ncbi:unnamed protein product [Alternaria alternata]